MCDRTVFANGLCQAHNAYQKRTGRVPTHRILRDIPFEERFWGRTSPGENGCIVWTGATTGQGRYGSCQWQGKPRLAHVVSYLAFVGEYDRSLELDHLCRTTLCVNPLHLEPVTHIENMRRAAPTHCKWGHEFTPENTVLRPRGHRDCRICRAERNHRNYLKRKAAA